MDNIKSYNVELLEGQIDLILTALELYSFNFHNTWSLEINSNDYDLKNALIFHTYESLVAQRKESHNFIYNFPKKFRILEKFKKGIA